jgi:DNA invertase Pin-like site-specific DNA recombinase
MNDTECRAGALAEAEPFAVVYGRVSTNKQKDSLDLQEKKALEYAAQQGFALHGIEGGMFLDEAKSGAMCFFDRPAAKRLMETLRKHSEIKHVIMGNLDRLGREARDHLNLAYELPRMGVALHILDYFGRQIRFEDPAEYFMYGILALGAKLELSHIRFRIRKRVNENFEAGLLIGTVPYGYNPLQCGTKRNKVTGQEKPLYRLVPNLAEQAQIVRMKRWRDAGCSDHEIAQQLKAENVPTKIPKGTRIKLRNAKDGQPEVWAECSGKWQAQQVGKILASRHTARLLAELEAEDGAAAA